MEFRPSKIEVEKVSALKPFDRYQYTVRKVADFEFAYTLAHEDGTWALAEVEGKTLVSIWPAAEYANALATGEWKNYKSLAVSLEEFMSARLEAFTENEFLVNVFSTQGKIGFVVTPDELKADLEEELENY